MDDTLNTHTRKLSALASFLASAESLASVSSPSTGRSRLSLDFLSLRCVRWGGEDPGLGCTMLPRRALQLGSAPTLLRTNFESVFHLFLTCRGCSSMPTILCCVGGVVRKSSPLADGATTSSSKTYSCTSSSMLPPWLPLALATACLITSRVVAFSGT